MCAIGVLNLTKKRDQDVFLDAGWQESKNNNGKGNYYTLCKVRRLHLDLTSVMGGPITVDIWCEHGCVVTTFRLHMQINNVENRAQ